MPEGRLSQRQRAFRHGVTELEKICNVVITAMKQLEQEDIESDVSLNQYRNCIRNLQAADPAQSNIGKHVTGLADVGVTVEENQLAAVECPRAPRDPCYLPDAGMSKRRGQNATKNGESGVMSKIHSKESSSQSNDRQLEVSSRQFRRLSLKLTDEELQMIRAPPEIIMNKARAERQSYDPVELIVYNENTGYKAYEYARRDSGATLNAVVLELAEKWGIGCESFTETHESVDVLGGDSIVPIGRCYMPVIFPHISKHFLVDCFIFNQKQLSFDQFILSEETCIVARLFTDSVREATHGRRALRTDSMPNKIDSQSSK